MKTLYLLRHAKAVKTDLKYPDLDRPLNPRGMADAQQLGDILYRRKIQLNRIITSHAKRAISTAKYICRDIYFPEEDLIVDQRLYHLNRKDFFSIINNLNEDLNSVMMISHNPGLLICANFLMDKELDNLPSCALLTVHLSSWKNPTAKGGKFISLELPQIGDYSL